jgi:hypothetical protein
MNCFVRHDQMVLGFDRGLHVIAHQARALGLGDHRAAIRIGLRQLPVGLMLQFLADRLHPPHLLAQRLDLLLQPLGLRLDLRRLGTVSGLQRR